MFLIDPKISPQILCEVYKDDLNINKLKLHRNIFHDIIKGQGLIFFIICRYIDLKINHIWSFI